jgi:glyoxylase-like metal-dependent hydrolase (beta-lactamase superfamily II)
MNRLHRLLLTLAGAAAALWIFWGSAAAQRMPAAPADRPELAYLMQVNAWRPPSDPQLLFLLMAQFANANRHAEGIAFLDALRTRFDAQLSDPQRALYLTAIASLRAGHADQVFLLRRIGWVRDTVAMLDEAKRLSGGELFVVRWMSGIVRAQLPAMFGEREAARRELDWCVAHADKAPHAGWLREAYVHLAALHAQRGDAASAQRLRALSGDAGGDRPAVFTTPFSRDRAGGHQFWPRRIREVIPDRVYAVSGYEFTEFYFVVSADRRELLAIDAGTRVDSAREAHEALRARVPGLPPLTTVLVTHAHWDHVGGHAYFRSLGPSVRFIGRANYADELRNVAQANPATLAGFFGTAFRLDGVLSYRPDVAIERATELTIGGTRVQLLPTRGGETEDALLVQLPEHRVLFVGDILMPYLGAPFVEEGSLEGLLDAIRQVDTLKPRHLLHGHETLTQLFSSPEMLNDLARQLAWLRDAVQREIPRGTDRAALHSANLVPPELANSPSSVHLAFLVLRENVINRLFDQRSGYWKNGLQGLDALGDADHGAALVDYLGLGEARIARAAERMVADGRHELAASLLRSAQARLPQSERLAAVRRLVYLKLMEKYQDFNPFKFIVYAAEIDQVTPQMSLPAVAASQAGP